MTTETIWFSPTDLVTGDPTLQVSYPSVRHPAVEIRTKTRGDLKWVYLGLDLPPCIAIKAVRVCYQLTGSRNFISQVRLTEMQTPERALVRHDDPTDLTSTHPTCYISEVGAYRPEGAVTLQLRLKFRNRKDKITLGAIGVDIERFEASAANVKCFGAIADGNSHPLRERFSTLEEAQSVYPHARSLDDEIDWAAIQAALDAFRDDGGPGHCAVYLPAGVYTVDRPLVVPPSVHVYGDGVGCTEVVAPAVATSPEVRGFIYPNTAVFNFRGDGLEEIGRLAEDAFEHDCIFQFSPSPSGGPVHRIAPGDILVIHDPHQHLLVDVDDGVSFQAGERITAEPRASNTPEGEVVRWDPASKTIVFSYLDTSGRRFEPYGQGVVGSPEEITGNMGGRARSVYTGGSYNVARRYYNAGEFLYVSHVEGNTVHLYGGLQADYARSDVRLWKMITPTMSSIHDMTIRGDGGLRLLFSLGWSTFEGDLAPLPVGDPPSPVPDSLRREFETHGISLSDASIMRRERDNEWRITDRSKAYTIERRADALNIYGSNNMYPFCMNFHIGRNVSAYNLRLENSPYRCLELVLCFGALCHNIHVDQDAHPVDSKVAGGSGIGCANSQDVQITNCRINATRHAVSSGGYAYERPDRTHLPNPVNRHIVVSNCELRNRGFYPDRDGLRNAAVTNTGEHGNTERYVYSNNRIYGGVLLAGRLARIIGNEIYGVSFPDRSLRQQQPSVAIWLGELKTTEFEIIDNYIQVSATYATRLYGAISLMMRPYTKPVGPTRIIGNRIVLVRGAEPGRPELKAIRIGVAFGGLRLGTDVDFSGWSLHIERNDIDAGQGVGLSSFPHLGPGFAAIYFRDNHIRNYSVVIDAVADPFVVDRAVLGG